MNRVLKSMGAPVVLAGSLLAGCSDSGTAGDTRPQATEQSTAWLLASAPGDAVGVLDAKANASQGDTITLRGIIGGRVDAMSTESAIFVMIDDSIDNPCTVDDDHCPTPWDYCCSEQSVLSAGSATVQLVDAQGNTIEGDLREHGIAPLDSVVVVGTVGARPNEGVLTLRATGIYKSPGF